MATRDSMGQTFGTGRTRRRAEGNRSTMSNEGSSRSQAAARGLEARGDYGRLLDRTYQDLQDPNYQSRYMSEAAGRALGGFGSRTPSGAQIAAMGDIGARASQMAGERAQQALGVAQERQAFRTELEALSIDSRDRLQQIIADNRDLSGRLTPAGRRELDNEFARLELSIGPERAQGLRSSIMSEAEQSGPNWLQRLFGARG
jgi:hypothetical protein